MKQIYIISFILLTHTIVFCQKENTEREKNAVITIGFLQGGGGLVGFDFDKSVYKNLSVQFGLGLFSYGGGINYHFKPTVRSSFISFQYWNQGMGSSFVQNVVGPSYVFRAKKYFTFQIGYGWTLSRGPAYPWGKVQPPQLLLYSIGFYLPF